MTLGGAAQVAAAHCPNKRTLDPIYHNVNVKNNYIGGAVCRRVQIGGVGGRRKC